MLKSLVGIIEKSGLFSEGNTQGREDRNFTLLEILTIWQAIEDEQMEESREEKEMNIHIVSGSGLMLFYKY